MELLLHHFTKFTFAILSLDLTFVCNGCRSKWIPTRHCKSAVYERLKLHMNGMHIVKNAFWGLNHGVNVRYIVRKDTMHAFDHGVSEQMMKSTIH